MSMMIEMMQGSAIVFYGWIEKSNRKTWISLQSIKLPPSDMNPSINNIDAVFYDPWTDNMTIHNYSGPFITYEMLDILFRKSSVGCDS
jgi:hypothetical protein